MVLLSNVMIPTWPNVAISSDVGLLEYFLGGCNNSIIPKYVDARYNYSRKK